MEHNGLEWTIDPDANFDLAGQVQALPDFNLEDLEVEETGSAQDKFLAKMTTPYKLMITNLPNNVSKSDLVTFVQTDLNITSAEINFAPGQPFCYIKFPNLDSCAEAMNVDGQAFNGRTLRLKISSSDQHQVVRQFNVRSKNSGRETNKNRFTQLKQENRRGGGNSRQRGGRIPEAKKHNYPVGGTIRKNRKKNTQKHHNTSQKSNAWGTGGREQPARSQNRRRGDPTYDDNRNRNMQNNNNRRQRFTRNENSRNDNRSDRRDNNRMNDRRGYNNDGDNFNRGSNNRFSRNERNENRGWNNNDDNRGNDRGFGRRNNDRDPESSTNWRNTDNHGNQKLTIKRRQNRAPVKDQDGYSTTKTKPVKSVAREKMSAKKKIAEEKETKQKSINRFDLFLQDDE